MAVQTSAATRPLPRPTPPSPKCVSSPPPSTPAARDTSAGSSLKTLWLLCLIRLWVDWCYCTGFPFLLPPSRCWSGTRLLLKPRASKVRSFSSAALGRFLVPCDITDHRQQRASTLARRAVSFFATSWSGARLNGSYGGKTSVNNKQNERRGSQDGGRIKGERRSTPPLETRGGWRGCDNERKGGSGGEEGRREGEDKGKPLQNTMATEFIRRRNEGATGNIKYQISTSCRDA